MRCVAAVFSGLFYNGPMPVDQTSSLPERVIRPLPPLLVNQIAAGEVVERPASVVKEVVENALDAGARRIELELEAGGIELIRVTDDGHGMPPEQLPLAIAPHATSKISVSEDLDRIATFGFRGEALASIASVSRMSIRSRTANEPGASMIEVEGVTAAPIKPAGGPVGTQVSIRNLFFNTPARRKFLRTPSTEQGHCVDAMTDLAMAHPGVAFVVRCDGRTVLDVPSGQTPKQRAVALLGQELAEELLEVSVDRFDDARGLTLWGLIGTPSLARATAKAQHVFLNGRTIRDKTVQHAIREAYRGLIEPGRHPTAVLMIEMDPGAVDVNVHPAKTEVRFRDQSLVHGTVLRAIRDRLAQADLTPRVGAHTSGGAFSGERAILPSGGTSGWGGAAGRSEWKPPRESPADSQKRLSAFVDYFQRPAAGEARPQERLSFQTLRDSLNEELSRDDAAQTPNVSDPLSADAVVDDGAAGVGSVGEPLLDTRPAERVLQVHNSYVVTQDEEGLVIVDQHALHERVMFEYLLTRVTRGGEDGSEERRLESQRLLVPIVVQATPRIVERLDDFRPLFDRIGVDAAALSPASIGVSAFPTFLFDRGVEPGEFLSDLFEKADADGFVPTGEEALHEVLDMMACKAAIKAGNRLTDDQVRDLVKLRDAVGRSSNCPHGRPTTIKLTVKDLEKLFGRV